METGERPKNKRFREDPIKGGRGSLIAVFVVLSVCILGLVIYLAVVLGMPGPVIPEAASVQYAKARVSGNPPPTVAVVPNSVPAPVVPVCQHDGIKVPFPPVTKCSRGRAGLSLSTINCPTTISTSSLECSTFSNWTLSVEQPLPDLFAQKCSFGVSREVDFEASFNPLLSLTALSGTGKITITNGGSCTARIASVLLLLEKDATDPGEKSSYGPSGSHHQVFSIIGSENSESAGLCEATPSSATICDVGQCNVEVPFALSQLNDTNKQAPLDLSLYNVPASSSTCESATQIPIAFAFPMDPTLYETLLNRPDNYRLNILVTFDTCCDRGGACNINIDCDDSTFNSIRTVQVRTSALTLPSQCGSSCNSVMIQSNSSSTVPSSGCTLGSSLRTTTINSLTSPNGTTFRIQNICCGATTNCNISTVPVKSTTCLISSLTGDSCLDSLGRSLLPPCIDTPVNVHCPCVVKSCAQYFVDSLGSTPHCFDHPLIYVGCGALLNCSIPCPDCGALPVSCGANNECLSVDCSWSEWSEWSAACSPCIASDNGCNNRSREVVQQACNLGNQCTGLALDYKVCQAPPFFSLCTISGDEWATSISVEGGIWIDTNCSNPATCDSATGLISPPTVRPECLPHGNCTMITSLCYPSATNGITIGSDPIRQVNLFPFCNGTSETTVFDLVRLAASLNLGGGSFSIPDLENGTRFLHTRQNVLNLTLGLFPAQFLVTLANRHLARLTNGTDVYNKLVFVNDASCELTRLVHGCSFEDVIAIAHYITSHNPPTNPANDMNNALRAMTAQQLACYDRVYNSTFSNETGELTYENLLHGILYYQNSMFSECMPNANNSHCIGYPGDHVCTNGSLEVTSLDGYSTYEVPCVS